MKNIIPLVIAVILGLAAVFAVSRTVSKNKENTEMIESSFVDTSEEVQDSRNSKILQGMLDNIGKPIPEEQRETKGDYLLLSDVGMSRSMGNVIGDGEWGFPINFADSSLVAMLQPGDEIAIIGTFKVSETVKQGKNLDAKEETFTRTVTSVIFPRVRILEITPSGGVFLSLPPPQGRRHLREFRPDAHDRRPDSHRHPGSPR